MTLTDLDIEQQLSRLKNEVGNTPIIDLSVFSANKKVKIFAKQEWLQLSGSVKARAAFAIVKDALLKGQLEGKTLLDASSGNTGIAYAAIAKELGISVAIVLPENASIERKELLQAYNANIIYSSPFGGTDEAQTLAKELSEKHPEKYFYADQYNNANNWKAHYYDTAEEIIAQSQGKISHFVTGLGSCGTFTGVAKKLSEKLPHVKRIALQPDGPMHILEGWKHLETAVIPGILDESYIQQTQIVDSTKAIRVLKDVYQKFGLKLSPSSAANLLGAIQVSEQTSEGYIMTILPDNADKYSEVLKNLNLN